MKLQRLFLVLCVAISSFAATPAMAGEDDVVAVFEIKGALKEALDQSGLGEIFGDKVPTTMFDLLESSARADRRASPGGRL